MYVILMKKRKKKERKKRKKKERKFLIGESVYHIAENAFGSFVYIFH